MDVVGFVAGCLGGRTRVRPKRLAGFALPLLLVAGLVAAPVPTAIADTGLEPPAECPAEIEADPEAAIAPDAAQALELAAACGVPVEVSNARGFDERTWAQPEGDLRTEAYSVPQWAPDESGDWVGIDPTLEWAEDGSVGSTATVSEIRISGGGDGPFVSATDPAGGTLSLTWPDPLPTPTLSSDTATYPNVYPGVDLTATAGVDGFSYGLVVHTPEAATNPALARIEVSVAGDGLDISQDAEGLVVAGDGSSEPVFVAGTPLMWDSSSPERTGGELDETPGRVEAISMELDGTTLAVIPNAAMLAERGLVFPMVIDPFFTGKRTAWANAHRDQPSRGWTNDSAWPRAGGMRVGLCSWSGCGDSWGLWRSVVRFNTQQLNGRHIISSAVKMTQTHTAGCGTYALRLWQVNAFTSGVSWNGVNWLHGSSLQSKDVASSNSTGCGTSYPNRAVTFNSSAVKARVQHHANQSYDSISFGLRSGSESDRNQWRRISRDSLRLEVVHASYPQQPTNLSTHGKGCATSSPGPWLTTGRPTLTGVPRNADGNGHYRIEVHKASVSGAVYSYRSGTVTVNRSASHTLTSTLPDGAYRWRMRTESATSGVPVSDFAGWCYFPVDTTPPPMPSASQLTDNPQLGDPVQFRLTGSSDTNRFRFNLSGGANTTVNASGGTVTITVNPPTTSIDHQLQVWALDAAGNLSGRRDVWFTTAKDLHVPVAGAWRFDGDWRDDSGKGHHVNVGPGVSLTSDRQGRPAAATQFSAVPDGCLRTDAPVLDTETSFTVAAWVRLSGGGGTNPAVVTQAGDYRPAFYLEWHRSSNRWNFSMPSADQEDVTWRYARASESPMMGEWQHVAGVYDAAARRLRLYVGGALQATSEAHPTTWAAPSPLVIGCAARTSGDTWHVGDSTIDDVVAYQGVLTRAQIEQLMTGGPPAGQVSSWPLRGNGADAGPGGHDLTMPDSTTWVPDSFGRNGSAMQLDGQSCAATDGPVVRTDDSFTVAASARPADDGTNLMTVLSQAGASNTAFRLTRTDTNQWTFNVLGSDESSPVSYSVQAPAAGTTGGWQHLVGVYDAPAGEIRIYVDGVHQGVATGPTAMWRSSGGLRVGCAATATGASQHFNGAVHDVRVWRGAATPQQVRAVAVERESFWGLDADGQDGWGDNDLTFHGDYEWVDDRFGFPESAFGLALDGSGYAQTAGPVVVTDESFTVSAWAKIEDKSELRTVLAQAGNVASSFNVNYSSQLDRWAFAIPTADAATGVTWHRAQSAEAPVVGQWYHLTGVFDLGASEIRLYVNGELHDTAPGPGEPWHADGELLIGTAGDNSGGRWSPMVGAIDMVRVYSGVLDERRIADQGVVPASPFGRNLIE